MAYMIPYIGADREHARKVRATKVNASLSVKKPKPALTPAQIAENAAVAEIEKIVMGVEPPEFPNLSVPAMPPAMKQTLFDVCRKYNVHPNDVAGVSRRPKVSTARREYCYRCRHELKKSYAQIGRSINKDHSTVIYACKMEAVGAKPYSYRKKTSVDSA